MSATKAVSGTVQGRVQGVGFRFFAERCAEICAVTGWVRNEYDGSVSFFAQGEEASVNTFVEKIRQGPRFGMVKSAAVMDEKYNPEITEFKIRY